MPRWIKDRRETQLMRLLEESDVPLTFEALASALALQSGHRPPSRKSLQRQLDRWRRRHLVEAVWQDGEVCYLGKGTGRSTPGYALRQPPIDGGFHDRLLFAFCCIALVTLLTVALYVFMD